MKIKYLCYLSILIFSVTTAFNDVHAARKENTIWIEANAGYGFTASGQFLIDEQNIKYTTNGDGSGNSKTDTSYSAKNVFGSLGKGLNFSVNAGMGLSEAIDIGIGFTALLASGTSATRTYEEISNYFYSSSSSTYDSILKEEVTIKGYGFWFTPFIKVKPGWKTFNPYAKFGLIVAFLKVKETHDQTMTSVLTSTSGSSGFYNENMSGTGKLEVLWSGGISIGYDAAAGFEYNLSKSLALYGEISLVSLMYNPSKREASFNATFSGSDNRGNSISGKVNGSNSWDIKDETSKTRDDAFRNHDFRMETKSVTTTTNATNYYDGQTDIENREFRFSRWNETFQFGSIGVKLGIKFTLFD